MGRDWEATFRAWSKPSSDTETTKCENAERMIRDAIRAHPALKNCNIDVFAQGSYRNNTNVRLDSDVDICVCSTDCLFSDFSMATGFTKEEVGLGPAPYSYADFKNEVERALVAKFGRPNVKRGNKAFDIHENTYRVDADVVACFEHRRYLSLKPYGGFHYESGTQFLSDNGGSVVNWPEQHYVNGVTKNKATGNRFKYITRVLKRLRNEMAEKDIREAAPMASFLIECLAWNTPNACFGHEQYVDAVRAVILSIYGGTETDAGCQEWGEVNELKYLFRGGQPWTRQQANAFMGSAWNYVGYK